jgi:chromosome segregation ATPase
MPEITNRDRINKKLQEFDDRLDGALSAVETMIRQKETTKKLVASIQNNKEESTTLVTHLRYIKEEWEKLKGGVTEAQEDAEMSYGSFFDRFDQARSDLEQHFNNEVELLHEINLDLRSEHYQFSEQSRTHAEKTAHDRVSITDSICRAEHLMMNIEQNLHGEIEKRLAKNEVLTGDWREKIENEWKEKVANLKKSMEEELSSLKKANENSLKKHQQGVEQHLMEFLGKQNVLVQNLAQQIDGFQRTMQTYASVQQAAGRKIDLLEKAAGKISEQEAIVETLQNDMQTLNTRLKQTINRLQALPFVKNSFKDL